MPAFTILTGIVALGAAVVLGSRSRALMRRAQQVPGVIIKNDRRTSTDGASHYAVYRYFFNGQEYVNAGQVGAGRAHVVGTEVTLLIDPAEPNKPRKAGVGNVWLMTAVCAGSGVFIVAVGVIMLVFDVS